jgi:NAD(P)-dependent dehydrogenase (short-subunit alcohol dehydrogenase family)
MNMETKVAVVSGTSSGIGKAICEKLLSENYKVYGISRNQSIFDNQNFTSIQVDLCDEKNYEIILSKINEEKIDLLVNNAGVCFEVNGLEFTKNNFESMFFTNFRAPILLTQTLKNKLTSGLVINISSVSDRIVGEKYGLYCSSKAALNKYFEVIALEEKQIKFVSVLPSFVDTPMIRPYHENDLNWNEILKPNQIADFVKLIIESGNKFASGTKIIVVTNSLKDDLEYKEDLWGYNVDTKELIKL